MREPTKSRAHPLGGEQRFYTFENGWGASVVQNSFSYGGSKGLYELGVTRFGRLDYLNPIADGNVVGCLTEQEVDELLTQLEAYAKTTPLPRKES